MHVVAAGVHHRDGCSGLIGCGLGARVGQPGLFGHGKGVHICPQHRGAAFAVAQDADNACTADSGRDFEAPLGQEVGDNSRGAFLLERQLGVGVKVAVDISKRIVGDHGLDLPRQASPVANPLTHRVRDRSRSMVGGKRVQRVGPVGSCANGSCLARSCLA